jgi:LPS-assembly protein
MHKKVFVFLFLNAVLFADTQNVEMIAKSVRQENNTIYANGDVVVYSERYLITADNAKYNTKTKDIELFGNINILRGSEEMSRSEYVFLNLEKDLGDFSQFFFFNQESKLWLRCGEASMDPEYYMAQKAVTSSCDVEDPDWRINFSSGKLNKESRFLHLYNAFFYIKDTPIFYMPYFAFPTDKTRRTGLLRPEAGYTRGEGVFYTQPFYLAPYDSWDLEFDPQIRTDRGNGIYSTFRFADSLYSNGYLTAGFFRENDYYKNREDLKNKVHFGYDFFYDRSSVVSNLFGDAAEDGLRIDLKYLNDVDYLNLKTAKPETFDKLVTSRLNYFLRDESNYIGFYGKYFIDTSAADNDHTLQEIPTIQYHKFLDSLLLNNIRYSIDAQYHNYYRKTGLEAQQFEVRLPITFYWSMFEGALRASISENIYMMRVNYEGLNSVPENYGQYLRNYHILSVYTDLAKAYESFYHKFYLGVEHVIPSFDKQKGYLDRDDFVPINTEEKQVALKFKQYFYAKDGRKFLAHSLSQPYYFDNYSGYKYAPLENKVEVFLTPQISFSNEFQYSHERGDIIKSLTYASYNVDGRQAHFSHIYNKNDDNNYFSLNFENKIFKNSSIFAEIQYDINDSFIKAWNVGLTQRKRCWDYRLVYREDISPKLASSGKASAVDKRGIYLIFNLYPLGGVRYEYSMENSKEL